MASKKAKKNSGYDWSYSSFGGVVRVNVRNGEDIAHLGELDQKLWTVLSCPVKGLEFDEKTLQMLDTDGDGKIRVNEIVAAAKWLTSVIKDKDLLIKGDSVLPLDQINTENEAGARLYKSARQILSNLKLDKDEISIEDSSDSIAIFAETGANGDGVITEASASDEALKEVIRTIVACAGSAMDRSGVAGVTAELIETFYTALADYSAWCAAGTADIAPYGDNTQAALDACNALRDKVADYFMRCKLIAFDENAAPAVDVSVDAISAISADNLASRSEDIAAYPLARPTKAGIIPFEGINPAWKARFDALRALVKFEKEDGVDEAEWNALLGKFAAFEAWKAGKKGEIVEPLGIEKVNELLKADAKPELLKLVDADKALEDEANSIDEVNKLMHLYRDFYKLLRNYVIFTDFYSPDQNQMSVFESGKLYIDERCCRLCVRVEDMGKHADMAGLSGMFLLYCNCKARSDGRTMNIVAVMTDGKTRNLRPGTNGVFYDREGRDYDATIVRVVENPISIKQAFWAPYVKFWRHLRCCGHGGRCACRRAGMDYRWHCQDPLVGHPAHHPGHHAADFRPFVLHRLGQTAPAQPRPRAECKRLGNKLKRHCEYPLRTHAHERCKVPQARYRRSLQEARAAVAEDTPLGAGACRRGIRSAVLHRQPQVHRPAFP